MPDRQADDLYRLQHYRVALDTVVDTVNIALHLPVPIVPIDFVVVVAADMNPLMDEFVPYSKQSTKNNLEMGRKTHRMVERWRADKMYIWATGQKEC